MGLQISEFKKNGFTFTNAYAKVGNIRYDNDSKIASFGIKIFTNKDDKNLVSEIKNQWVKVEVEIDIVSQCYNKIDTNITQLKQQIVNQEIEIEKIKFNDNQKLRLENQLNMIKNSEILQLDGSIEL